MQNNHLLSLCHYDLCAPDGNLLQQGLHLELRVGEVLLIKGPNGSGKTTLINSLAEMLRKSSFKIEVLPQLMNLKSFLPLSLKDVLDISCDSITEKQILDLDLLEKRHFTLSWNGASGGEKKRVLLSRSLLTNPEILILDEPFNHLDATSVEKITATLARLIKNKTLKALIVVSHPVYFENPVFEGVPLVEVEL